MKAQYLHCPWNTSLDEWYKKWFYIREEPNTITLCDVGLIPEKKGSWSERPENLEQIAELLGMIPWGRLDGPSVVGNFISRRIQPCQKRIHPGFEYQGGADPTRTRKEPLDKMEIKARIGELFNLADPNYVALNAIEHAFKLARPPPKYDGRDRAGVFVSPPPGVEWPQATGPTAQTSARTDGVHWAVLETVEDASTRAAGKRPAASKRRQAIISQSDDEAEDADIFRLVPRKRRRQVGPSEQGGSSVPAVVTAPTTATQSTDEENMPLHPPTPVPEVGQNLELWELNVYLMDNFSEADIGHLHIKHVNDMIFNEYNSSDDGRSKVMKYDAETANIHVLASLKKHVFLSVGIHVFFRRSTTIW
ncbi:uncharacterized protein [Miscanthus floridulus]|uniref:uncharacterized protein n=1 Tax=Miscanthus floridulus TaxID=154761 RepID=UPI00345A90D2